MNWLTIVRDVCGTVDETPALMRQFFHPRVSSMLYTVVVILLVLWLLGAFVVPVGGGLIHILLVIAVVVLIFQLISGRRAL